VIAPGSPVSVLTELARWVGWRTEKRRGKPDAKWTKVPYTPGLRGRRARTDDASTWASYDEACKMEGCDGPGLVLTGLGEVAALDLDGCRDDETGRIEPWALALCERAQSYTEITPSRRGLRVLGLAEGVPPTIKTLPRGGGQQLEIFAGGATKYITMSFERLVEYPGELNDIGPLVRELLEEAEAGKRKPLPPARPRPATKGAASILKKLPNDYSRAGWVRLGLAHKAAGGSFEDFDTWSTRHPSYDPHETRRVWESLKPNGAVSAATLAFEARQHGIAVPATTPGSKKSEDQIALGFAEHYQGRFIYDHTGGTWLQWSGEHWRRDELDYCFDCARTEARAAGHGKIKVAANVERAARSDPRLARAHDSFDCDLYLLGMPRSTAELTATQIGALKIRPPDPRDLITKQTAAAPAEEANCPLWLAFLDEATGGDPELVKFLQRWCGYSLTGCTSEHALLFVHGDGGTGKTTFANTIAGVMGDYAVTAPMDTFVSCRSERHPTDLAMLCGARLVVASETQEGRAWDETRIKQLTGGDAITARFMRRDFFTFRPAFKLLILGNHQPVLHNVGQAERRRFCIVPFCHKPAKPDPRLEEKLRVEWPGILR
jgi:putative DNA primase/helicase